MNKDLYNNNIHPRIINLFNKKKKMYSLRSTNEFVIPNISRYYGKFSIVIKVLCYRIHYILKKT